MTFYKLLIDELLFKIFELYSSNQDKLSERENVDLLNFKKCHSILFDENIFT